MLYECVLCFNLSLSLSFWWPRRPSPKNMKIKMTSKCEGCARLFLYNLNMMSVIYSFNCEQNNTHIHMNGFPKIEVPKALPHTSQEWNLQVWWLRNEKKQHILPSPPLDFSTITIRQNQYSHRKNYHTTIIQKSVFWPRITIYCSTKICL